ncbi:Branchpoint-bridging protein [Frankliniella fusca]|uniref:Branchpoint-bridging protein n=1 Tax=Frankliniella fusca TaxID=407009 RepID=A0AAE1I2Z3_9NEOP|nr:Branchpoint-bridging protein [Frankliniella fusca]
MVYISGKYAKLTKEDFEKMNTDITNNNLKFYLVSRGGVSLETVVLDLMPLDKCSNLPLFDVKCPNCDESSGPSTPSPLKKFKSNYIYVCHMYLFTLFVIFLVLD